MPIKCVEFEYEKKYEYLHLLFVFNYEINIPVIKVNCYTFPREEWNFIQKNIIVIILLRLYRKCFLLCMIIFIVESLFYFFINLRFRLTMSLLLLSYLQRIVNDQFIHTLFHHPKPGRKASKNESLYFRYFEL